MQRDLIIVSGGLVAISIISWASLKDPARVPTMHTVQETLYHDPQLNLVSEQSPHMRNER
jgi:hypothetical protein